MPARKKEIMKLEGNLDIRQAETIQSQLVKLNKTTSRIVIDLSDAEDIDFPIIQLLYSFKKSRDDQKFPVQLKDMNSKITEKIKISDLQYLLQE